MKNIKCKYCGSEFITFQDICPVCGKKLSNKPKVMVKRIVIIIIVSFFFSIILNHSNTSSNNMSSHEIVKNSSWDSSVWQVKSWLKKAVKDPSSLEFIEWSSVFDENDGGFSVIVSYRAKNSFGGYVVERKKFFLNSSGRVKYYIEY